MQMLSSSLEIYETLDADLFFFLTEAGTLVRSLQDSGALCCGLGYSSRIVILKNLRPTNALNASSVSDNVDDTGLWPGLCSHWSKLVKRVLCHVLQEWTPALD